MMGRHPAPLGTVYTPPEPRNPWQSWWAWYPVKVNGRWHWCSTVYRQYKYAVIKRYGKWVYGDLFDYLRWKS